MFKISKILSNTDIIVSHCLWQFDMGDVTIDGRSTGNVCLLLPINWFSVWRFASAVLCHVAMLLEQNR